MTDNTKNTTTGEPVNQAPATTEAVSTTAETPTNSPTIEPANNSTTAPVITNPYGAPPVITTAAPVPLIKTMGGTMLLPAGYLSNGSMLDEDGVMLPEYLEKYPQALAEDLKPLSAASFQRAFISGARAANKKKVPYSVKKNCAHGMLVQAMKLTARTKNPAPPVLLDMIRAATATVVDNTTFAALCLHLEAVGTYLLMN